MTCSELETIVFAWAELPHYGARLLKEAIASLGVTAYVISTKSAIPIANVEDVLGQEIHWVNPTDLRTNWASLGIPIPSVFVVAGWGTPAFNALVRSAKVIDSRIVMIMDNPWNNSLRQKIGAIFFRLFKRNNYHSIWVPGQSGYQFAKRLGFSREEITTGLYSADPKVFCADIELEQRKRSFIYVGQLIERKGLRVLADAMRLLAAEGSSICVDVYGSGPMKEELATVPGLRLHGFLQSDAIAQELARSRFLILPSYEDHWGLVVLEATFCGCGIITTDGVESRHELVTKTNGWVYSKRSAGQLASCMRQALGADTKRLVEIELESRRLSAPYTSVAWVNSLRGTLRGLGITLNS